MPETIREYLYAALILGGAGVTLTGCVVFWAAMSLQTFLVGVLTVLVGGLMFTGAWKLKPQKTLEDMAALSNYLGTKKIDDKRGDQ